MNLYLGTQGWSYPSWVGPFYPAGTTQAAYLEHYATHFNTVELDTTFYAVPKASTIAGWRERTYVRRDDEPGMAQVDTVVPFAGEKVPDAVVIEPEEPAVVNDTAFELGAPARSLATVRDDTVFRDGDREAWFSLWQTLRSTDPVVLRKSPATSVSFAELFGQRSKVAVAPDLR